MIARNDKSKKQRKRDKKKRTKLDVERARHNAQVAFFELTLRKAMYLIVKLKGSINLTKEQLDSVPDDFQEKFEMALYENGVIYSIKKEGVLELPSNRIIV